MKDFTSDNSLQVLNKILRNNEELRTFLKTSGESLEASEGGITELPPEAYADSENMLFRLDSPEMAKMSYYYAKEQRASDEIIEKIAQALELYGEGAPVVTVSSLPAESTNYLLPDEQRYPANSEAEVKMASSYLEDYGYQFPIETRREYCKNLVKTAAAFSMDVDSVSSTVKRYAGLTGTNLQKFAYELANRIDICRELKKDNIYEDAYEKIGSECSIFEGPIVYDKPREFDTIASTLYQLDKLSGIDSYYGNTINDAFTAVFNSEKLAERALNIGTSSVPYSKLYKLSREDFSAALGRDFTDEVFEDDQLNIEKLSMIVPTLPLDMKRELLGYVRNT